MSTIVTRSGKGSPLTNTEVDANFTNLNTGKAELSGAVFTGAITTNSTIDGRDVAADGVTADAALPKSGGAMTGAITTNSTFDGRDVATDGTKLDGVEASADVTDAANVTAAGALMDSELTAIASVKALNQGVATGDSPTFAALTSTGEITANGGIALGDNDKATFGAGDDLQIFHDGSNSFIDDAGTGSLFVRADATIAIKSLAQDEYYIKCVENDTVELYNNGSKKLATTATGIDVTGTATMDGLSVDGTGTITFNDVGENIFSPSAGILAIESRGPVQIYGDSNNNGATTSAVFEILRDSTYAGNTGKSTLTAFDNGDISFYEDTGTTPKLFWDASAEQLAIGSNLNSVVPFTINADTSSGGAVAFLRASGTSNNGLVVDVTNTPDSYIADFRIGNSSKMRIDSSGNVGIGADAPTSPLHIRSATDVNVRFDDSGSSSYTWYMNDAQNLYIPNVQLASTHTFYAMGQRKVDIDSSGNLLVGKTSQAVETTGSEIGAGFIAAARNGTVGFFNRQSSDGEITRFSKDGTTVGSIGNAGTNAYINSQGGTFQIQTLGTGRYSFDVDQIYPQLDNAMNLGHPSYRFDNAYLSGGVYLGGTGAANKLDDYEEGTFTPTLVVGSGSITYATRLGTYTKVGRLVNCTIAISLSAVSSPSGTVYITGLPFTNALGEGFVSAIDVGITRDFSSELDIKGYVNSNATTIALGKNPSNTGHNNLAGGDLTSSTLFYISTAYHSA